MTKGIGMKHLDIDVTERTSSDRDWLRLGSQIGTLANEWSGRTDLVASVSSSGGEGAPACYKPKLAEIEINKNMVFGENVSPEMVDDFTERATQYEWAKVTGAVIHEAFHARFSNMDLEKLSKELSQKELQALILLEEGRIESLGVDSDSDSRVFLRSCAMDIVISEVKDFSQLNVASASNLVGLVHARVLNDILFMSEVGSVVRAVDDVLGQDVSEKLVSICEKFQAIENTSERSVELMKELAREWVKIVSDKQEENGEEDNEDGSGGSGGSGTSLEELLSELEDIATDVEISNFSELDNQQREQEWKDSSKQKSNHSKESQKSKNIADKVFGSKDDGEHGATTADLDVSNTNSSIVDVRKPNAQERVASVIIGSDLEKAKYRERDITEVSSFIPAGKLNTKVALQSKAEESRGKVSTLPSWRKKVRKHTDEPTLSVGILCDISGSMSDAMSPMATTAWVMSEATKRVQGKVAMAYFGNAVIPALKSGQTLSDVVTYNANDGTEKFDSAFMAINGELNLLDGNGARLLVVVSDGIYTDRESDKAKHWLNRCKESGVAVLWLPFSPTPHYSKNLCQNTGAVVMPNVRSTIESAREIGKVCCDILSKTY